MLSSRSVVRVFVWAWAESNSLLVARWYRRDAFPTSIREHCPGAPEACQLFLWDGLSWEPKCSLNS